MVDGKLRVLGIAGSLRKASFNRGLIRAAQEVASSRMDIETFDRLGDIPPYNDDVLQEEGVPPVVQEFKDRIRAADALLIATPEYNYGVPGVLKNAIDWASRPPTDNPFKAKPIGIMGASGGNFGTARGQMALRQTFVFVEGYVMVRPELLVFRADQRFDENGNLHDEATRKMLAGFLDALVDWTAHFSGARDLTRRRVA
jgi:chromate reductase